MRAPENTPPRSTVHSAEDFGRSLRTARRAQRLTQMQAAQLAGVSARLWNETELGKRENVAFETALRMLQTLGLDLVIESRQRGHAE
jgi:transcriptional regulator with XRE-family HTH domain